MAGPSPLVVLVDDNAPLREALCGLVANAGMAVCGFGGYRAFLADPSAHDCDCLVLEARLPDGDGLALHRQLAEKGISPPAVFISAHGDIPMAVQAMRQGALDFLEKPFGAQSLLRRVHEAVALSLRRRRQRADSDDIRTRIAELTPREREIMTQIVRGMANKAIGIRLGISVRTVEHHRARVMRKMGVDSLPNLVTILNKLDGQ